MGHTLTGELSEGVSGSYNQREALAAALQKLDFKPFRINSPTMEFQALTTAAQERHVEVKRRVSAVSAGREFQDTVREVLAANGSRLRRGRLLEE